MHRMKHYYKRGTANIERERENVVGVGVEARNGELTLLLLVVLLVGGDDLDGRLDDGGRQAVVDVDRLLVLLLVLHALLNHPRLLLHVLHSLQKFNANCIN